MPKSPDAFRTISEVADWLGIQAHVLRFWESKFTQVKPIKRAGGRRYYRPSDMQLLGGIKQLLHEDGLTIKGVQKILREEGMSHVAALSAPLDDDEEGEAHMPAAAKPTAKPMREPEEAVVLPFEAPKEMERPASPPAGAELPAAQETSDKPAPTLFDQPEEPAAAAADTDEPAQVGAPETAPQTKKPEIQRPEAQTAKPEGVEEPVQAIDTASEPVEEEQPESASSDTKKPLDAKVAAELASDEVSAEPEPPVVAARAENPRTASKDSLAEPEAVEPVSTVAPEEPTTPPAAQTAEAAPKPEDITNEPEAATVETEAQSAPLDEEPAAPPQEEATPLPSFLRSASPATIADTPETEQNTTKAAETVKPVAQTPEPSPTKARDIGMPTVTPEAQIIAKAATLTGAFNLRDMDAGTAQAVKPLLAQLSALRDRMAARPGAVQPKS